MNKNNKTIAILGANRQYTSFYKQTKDLGYRIIAFGRDEDDHICAKYADKFYPISFKEKDKILEICRKENVEGVTSFLIETALPYVYYISRGLGIPCNSEKCEAFTANKFTMRECLASAGIRVPQYHLVKHLDEVNDVQYPVIVKPSDAGGSRGITLANNRSELVDAFQRASDWSPSGNVLIEQYICGREFSIEGISYKGHHYILQITDKVTTGSPYFVELAHHQPADISEEEREKIKQLTIDMLNALQIEYGASHTEIKFDENNLPYIIEMGARMGGDQISSDLVRLSTGYNYVGGVLEIATGDFTTPVVNQKAYSGIYFLCKETQDKVLPLMTFLSQYDEIVDVDRYGEIIPVKCNSDRAGYFIYQSDKKLNI